MNIGSWSTTRSLPRDALFFLTASLINATGKAVMWPLTTIYVHNVLGKSYGDAGLILLFQAFTGVLGEFLGGHLYYRVGPKVLVTASLFLSSCFLLVIASTDNWPLFIAMAGLYGFFMAISNPAITAYIGIRWKRHRKRLYNINYVSNNFGLSIGAMAGGLIASYSFSLTYTLTSCTTLFFAVFFYFFIKKEQSSEMEHEDLLDEEQLSSEGPVELNPTQLLRNFRLYLLVSIGSLFFWISFAQWSMGVVPFIERMGLDITYYSFLWIVNGVVIMLGQPLTGWIKARLSHDLVRQMLASAIVTVTAFSYVLFFHQHYYDLVVGMVLATLGEMLLLPAIPLLYSERAGKYAAFYIGVTGGLDNVGRMIGPFILGHAFDRWGIGMVFLLGTSASIVSLLMFFFYNRMNRSANTRGRQNEEHERFGQRCLTDLPAAGRQAARRDS